MSLVTEIKNVSTALRCVISIPVMYYCWSLYGMLLQNQQVFIRISTSTDSSRNDFVFRCN